MNNQTPDAPKEPTVLHVEVAVSLLFAIIIFAGGAIAAVIQEELKPLLVCAIISCALVFLAGCFPQIRAARERRDQQREGKP